MLCCQMANPTSNLRSFNVFYKKQIKEFDTGNNQRTGSLTDQAPLYVSFSGGAGPLVICSDCYDNANIYSRTREYCPYAYLEDDDPLDKTLPGLKDGFHENDQHKDLALQNLISNQNSFIFLESHEKSAVPFLLFRNLEMWTVERQQQRPNRQHL